MSKSPKPSWRLALALATSLALGASDAAPITPAEQLRRLEETGLRQSREAIQTDAPLTPFAFVVRSDGRTQRLAARTSRRRSAQQIVAELLAGLREQARAGAYRAVAVFRFVVITLPDDRESKAIHVGIEHESGRCEEIFVPYQKSRKQETRFESPLRRSREPQIFEHCEPLPASTH